MENVILTLNKVAEGFWSFSGSMLIQSSILIVLLLVIDFFIRKRVRAVFRYCIWMLVFIKLLLPPTLCLPTGIGYWCGWESPEVVSAESLPEQTDVVMAEQGLQKLPEIQNMEPLTRTQVPVVNTDTAYMPVQQSEIPAVTTPTTPLTWQAFVLLGWLVGVLVLSVLLIQRFLFVKSLIAQSELAEGQVLDILNQCQKQVGMTRPIELRLTASMLSPAACGLLNPVILMPASLLDKLTEDKLKTVLIHELAHIKRGDLWVNFLQTVLQIAYFYNPLLWIANAVVRGIREKAVDEMVLTKLGDQADTYSNTLIDIAEIAFSKPHFSLRLVGVVESKKALTDRIKHILSRPFPKSAKVGIVGLAAVLITAAVLLPMAKGNTIKEMTPEELLEKMLEYRARVENLQFVTEYHTHNAIYGEALAEQTIKSMKEKGAPVQQIKMIAKTLGDVPEYRYQTLKCTVNNLEHVKIERTGGISDSLGVKVTSEDKSVSSWDGVSGIDFNQRKGSPSFASIKDSAPTGASKQGQPWKTFTGTFIDALSKAISSGEQITVNNMEDGTYYVEFANDTLKRVAYIDSSRGYVCSLEESYRKEQLSHRRTAKYEEVVNGIWFPVYGETISYSKDGSVRRKSSIATSQIRINDPDFDQSYFEVDFPEGTEVRDIVQGKKYVVGSDRTYELPGTQKSTFINDSDKADDDTITTVDPNSWQKAFTAVYRLDAHENLKWIAPPFIPEREQYFLNEPGRQSSSVPYHAVMRYVFHWDGKLIREGGLIGEGIPRLNSVLTHVIGLGNFEYQGPDKLLHLPVPGDWIVRKEIPKEGLLVALEKILFEDTDRKIHFEKRSVDEETIVVQGTYQYKPLKSLPESQAIHIFTDKIDPDSGAGGGSGTLGEFLKWVGNRVNMKLIDQTDSTDIKVSWRNHDSSDLTRTAHDETYYKKLDLLLNNLKQQTGLNFERQTGVVEKWFVVEKQSPASISQSLGEDSTNSEITTNNYTATLPNGVTVVLLGICEHPSDGKLWWKPDGQWMETQIKADSNVQSVYPIKEDEQAITMSLR